MNSMRLIHVLWCLNLYVTCTFIQVSSHECVYPAIYNFGDSNSDTGTAYAIFKRNQPPNGISFGNISGRASDGRLIIDYITEELKAPYLSAYLNSVGSNYRYGANFASGGASICPGSGWSPFDLGLQVTQFRQFKSQTRILFNNETEPSLKSGLPRPEDFSKALYTIDIGLNDLASGFLRFSEEQVQRSFPEILGNFSQAVKQLYNEGARVFWIHNVGPVGCLPLNYYSNQNKKKGNLDANVCVESENKITQELNNKLKDQVSQLRKELVQAKFTYVDMYKAKYELISNAKSQGFVSLIDFCCGSYTGDYSVNCGMNTNLCTNPSQHISWDGIHYSKGQTN
uniref:Coil protein n=1 Tax=Medicago sativa TaxID=3879 RepID=Q40318_MEDSA|nr:coil protein [Medicago sativa]